MRAVFFGGFDFSGGDRKGLLVSVCQPEGYELCCVTEREDGRKKKRNNKKQELVT